jgi:3-deoxy-D-manno-octulosonic-acid transferase
MPLDRVGLALWRGLATVAAPPLRLHLAIRARGGKEVQARLAERRGLDAVRPEGRLFWMHAASVGETLAALPLLERMATRDPALHILLTTGTVTSARLLEERLPPGLAGRVLHRFLPLDVPAWVGRFLDGWQPDAGAFMESELWPNLLSAAAARGIPLALVNARISPRSFVLWRRAPGLAARVLGRFRVVMARSATDAARLRALGLPRVEAWGDVKAAAPPLPAEPAALTALRGAVGERPVFLAASTHPGEEALALAAHARLAPALPGLLTLVVPRHPARGEAVAAEALAAGLPATRHSLGQAPSGPVHVGDTIGEMGLFYRLAPAGAGVVLVGGSLVPHGGQNPLEPARLGCPILLGPHTWNFEDAVARLLAAGGARLVPDAAALAEAVMGVLRDPAAARGMAEAAARVADAGAGLPDRIAAALLHLLPERAPAPGG